MRQQQIQDPQIHQLNNGNQEWGTTEERERDMISGVMQMNQGTKTSTLHSNQQQGEMIAKTKTKIQQKVMELNHN